MAWDLLRTDYKDAVFDGLRKYMEINNPDGTVSFADVTNYVVKELTFFGAKDVNSINTAVNAILAALENGTDLYQVFLDFFENQEILFTEKANEYIPQRINEIIAALSEMVTTNGEWRNDIAYQRYSIVVVTKNGVATAYIAINNVPAGIIPPNTAYWAPCTLQGEKGADAMVVDIAGSYAFQVIGGDLYILYEDGGTPPNMYIDENGDLIHEFEIV